jgi:hypothetical protein
VCGLNLIERKITIEQFVDDLVKYMAANDEWIGWAIWAAGPFWGTFSPCCGPDTGSLEPGNLNDMGGPKYAVNIFMRHMLDSTGYSAFSTVWAASIRPNIPKGESLTCSQGHSCDYVYRFEENGYIEPPLKTGNDLQCATESNLCPYQFSIHAFHLFHRKNSHVQKPILSQKICTTPIISVLWPDRHWESLQISYSQSLNSDSRSLVLLRAFCQFCREIFHIRRQPTNLAGF